MYRRPPRVFNLPGAVSLALAACTPASSFSPPAAKPAAGSPPTITFAERAAAILRGNDTGDYTVPARGLYPHQWNWDSALIGLGWARIDTQRAWRELESLLAAQWDDGMVPHIVFHVASSGYFPGPDIWQAHGSKELTSGITQPPIAATCVRAIIEASADRHAAFARARPLLPKLLAWHRWFYRDRDPDHTGLVTTLHPWETGMDNSPAWDEPMNNVPVDPLPPYQRQDTSQVDAAMRPHKEDYDRYLTLLYRFRAARYQAPSLYQISPFRITDVGTNAILQRANHDLLWLANALDEPTAAAQITRWIERTTAAFNKLWDESSGIYRSLDQRTGQLLSAATSAGFLPLFAQIPTVTQAQKLVATLSRWQEQTRYSVTSLDPQDRRFEARRYWRGPVWINVNWMIATGLLSYGYEQPAQRIARDTKELIEQAGFYEYFDPLHGAGVGAHDFSWTAAIALFWFPSQPIPTAK